MDLFCGKFRNKANLLVRDMLFPNKKKKLTFFSCLFGGHFEYFFKRDRLFWESRNCLFLFLFLQAPNSFHKLMFWQCFLGKQLKIVFNLKLFIIQGCLNIYVYFSWKFWAFLILVKFDAHLVVKSAFFIS